METSRPEAAMSTAAVTPDRGRTWQDGKRYMWPSALFVPLIPVVSYGVVSHSGNELFWWLAPLLIFGLIPVIDGIVATTAG
jgi:alkane 1-monooxygenase